METASADPIDTGGFDLPLLRGWLDKADTKPHAILDFGIVQPRLVSRIQRFGGKLQVLDIRASELNSVQLVDRLRNEIPQRSGQQYDLILTWDLINFFDSNQIQLLDAVLSETTPTGARMHALINYGKPEMPSSPVRFSIKDPFNVMLETVSPETVKAPRYSPKTLEKWMIHFKVDRSRLLGNGMQEYLFQRRN